jgi:subtilisin family serine protease
MKKKAALLVLLGLAVQVIIAVPPFIEGYFYPNEIAVGFDNSIVQQRGGVINFTEENGVVITQIESFDQLSRKFRFVNLEQKHPFVKDKEWNQDGIYPMNIYKITLERNDHIEEALSELLNNQNILFAEYETIYRTRHIPNDPMYGDLWGLHKLECDYAWDYTTGNPDVIIGIVDSGVYWIHPDLRDNIWINQAELNAGMTINWQNGTVSGGNGIDDDGNGKVDDVIGWNFYNNNNISFQSWVNNDHGTHVAGSAAAVGDNQIGIIGVAPNVKIMVSRHSRDNGNSDGISNGNNGIYYCADSGADVINCSWGGTGGGTQSNTAVNYATAQGALVVAAAGNSNVEHNQYYQDYPSDATNALSVAASDQNDLKTYFSDYGAPIGVSAPGIDIKSTIIGGTGYASYQGTSMSSPIVAGVAALVKSVHPQLSPLQIKQRIKDTTDYIDHLNPGFQGMLGTGRVNAFTATMYDLIPRLEISNIQITEAQGDGDGVPNPGEIINLTFVLQNSIFSSGFWAAAENVVVTVTSDMPGVSILNGTETFTIPFIGVAGAGNNFSNPVQIQTLETEHVLNIPVKVTVTANPTSAYPYHSERVIILPLSLEQSGWPFLMDGTSKSSALMVDIDNDGSRELVFTDSQNRLHAIKVDGVTELPGFPVSFGAQSGTISASVAIEDINNNGFLEIIVGNEAGYLFAVDKNGTILFTHNAGGQIRSNPIIADINGNGTKQIIASTFTSPKLIVLNADGSYFGGSPYTLSTGIMSSSAVGDISGDGKLEIVMVTVTGHLHVIDPATGLSIAGWPYALGIGTWNGPIVSNIDGDNQPEILVTLLNGKIVALNHDGTLRFERTLGTQVRSSVVTGDLNGNGSIEIITVSSAGMLYVMDNNGNDLNNFPLNMNVQIEATPILADMDGNGSIDIIFGDTSGYLHSINLNGNQTPNFPLYLDSEIKVSASIGDFDGDGDPEIVVPNLYSMRVIDFKRSIGNIKWSCFKRDTGRKGNSFFPTYSNSDAVEISSITTLLGKNYPNPFNPETKIEFNLQKEAFIALEIYNVKGQKVKTLVNDIKNAGYHTVVWNGKDNADKPVSSGIYFYKLQTDNYQSVRKMILMK